MQVLIAIAASVLFFSGYGQKETQPEWAELRPILTRLNLNFTTRQSEDYKYTWGLEEADAKAYGPLSGVTLFLKFKAARHRNVLMPRYWMRVEDYSTAEAAIKRATEYCEDPAGAIKRLEELHLLGTHPEKDTLRLWAVARGKRVYTLTTDTNAFWHDSLPGKIKTAIGKLPEK
jgi:hypothetical protein